MADDLQNKTNDRKIQHIKMMNLSEEWVRADDFEPSESLKMLFCNRGGSQFLEENLHEKGSRNHLVM